MCMTSLVVLDMIRAETDPFAIHQLQGSRLCMQVYWARSPTWTLSDCKVGESPDGRPAVCVNLKRVMDLLRLKQLEAAVRQRFGVSACRVFRLLTMKRQLEQKQIAELAMFPVKETREILYRLLKAGYLLLQVLALIEETSCTNAVDFARTVLMPRPRSVSNVVRGCALAFPYDGAVQCLYLLHN